MAAVQAVIRALHQAKLAGGAGNIPGDIEQIISKFLTPVVPWEMHLQRWMNDLSDDGFTWNKPSRRYMSQGLYLPAHRQDRGKLDHLIYYKDSSGSIQEADSLRFNSEFKYVKDTFRPGLMTLVQFDTKITFEQVYTEDDPFDQVKIVGRGGTSLVPVREHMLKHKPTAAIIFSDLECAAMEALPFDIPILWVCIRNKEATVPFGKIIHIR